MKLARSPEIAAGLLQLIDAVPEFAGANTGSFPWECHEPGFGGLLRTILGQQVSTRAADVMWEKLCRLMPKADPVLFLKLDETQLSLAGFSRQKMRYARALAETLIADPNFLERITTMNDVAAMATLISLPGVGRWTAEIYLMFALGRPDIWPASDLAIVIGVRSLFGVSEAATQSEIDALAERWRPFRSAAALCVWDHYLRETPNRRKPNPKKAET